jgi:hypothetical protein
MVTPVGSTRMRATTVGWISDYLIDGPELRRCADIVGVNFAPFFIQDASQFPDLVHAVKPMPNNEMPQAATAHTSAWDFFSNQASALHSALWLMSGHGIPRSFRHMHGYGIHSFRFVTAEGASKIVKFRWTTLQGVASLVWEEAQATAGKNTDYHRQDLYNAIAAGRYPKWEVSFCHRYSIWFLVLVSPLMLLLNSLRYKSWTSPTCLRMGLISSTRPSLCQKNSCPSHR